MTLYEQIYQVVQQIPYGNVATYGQIAELVGLVGRARQVGYALFRLAPDSEVPWHRVINAQGKISCSPVRNGMDEVQREWLEREGIVFNEQEQINLKKYRWCPVFQTDSSSKDAPG